MQSPYARHKGFWTEKRKRSMYFSVLLIILALIVQITFGHYSSRQAIAAPPENDIFLDNLPMVDLAFVIVGGVLIFWFFSFFLLSLEPEHLIFGIKAIALLIIVRAFFINLTHEGLYPNGFLPTPHNTGFGFYNIFTFEGNLFFSGHTAFPYLMALIFWEKQLWRRIFIAISVIFGASVLLAHVHYSIDVFAAPFITYGVFKIAEKIFPGDYALIARGR